MTQPYRAMPGFEGFMATLKRHGVGVDPKPAFPNVPAAGAVVLGGPFDSFLASLYTRCDGGRFGDLELFGFNPEPDSDDVISFNNWIRSRWRELEPRKLKCFEYGKEVGEPYYFATVPLLASPAGVQPVVCVADLSGFQFYPIASSVDKAFEHRTSYVAARLSQYGRLDEFMLGAITPPIWKWVELLARDDELVSMLKAGKFDALMGDEPHMARWKQSVLQAARAR